MTFALLPAVRLGGTSLIACFAALLACVACLHAAPMPAEDRPLVQHPPVQAELISSLPLTPPVAGDANFGGFSGIALDLRGEAFTLLSDRGGWMRGRIERDAEGRMSALRGHAVLPLLDEQGQPLPDGSSDSEGIAIARSGRVYISFEGPARILAYDDLNGPATPVPAHPAFKTLSANGALEALAIGPDGALWTLPEEPLNGETSLPLWRFDGEDWHEIAQIATSDGFLAVSADFGPDGRLYLLERGFSPWRLQWGFRARLRSFGIDPTDHHLTDERQELLTKYGAHDNLEGLSIWQEPSGALRATMVADNNFLTVQRSELVEYRLHP